MSVCAECSINTRIQYIENLYIFDQSVINSPYHQRPINLRCIRYITLMVYLTQSSSLPYRLIVDRAFGFTLADNDAPEGIGKESKKLTHSILFESIYVFTVQYTQSTNMHSLSMYAMCVCFYVYACVYSLSLF